MSSAQALWLPAIFGEHMVFQAGKPLAVWGKDAPGARVRVSLAGVSSEAVAGLDGRWWVELKALAAGGPHTLAVEGSARASFGDVLVGEVWLGSGQSNMEFLSSAAVDADGDLPRADIPRLRLFTVARATALEDREEPAGQWKACTPESAREFSAVGFHFGRELHEALGTPVGVVTASWGGTPAEDWVPRTELFAREPLRSQMEAWDSEPGRIDLWSKGMDFELELRDLRLVRPDGSALSLPLDGWAAEAGSDYLKSPAPGAAAFADGILRYAGRIYGSSWDRARRVLDSMDLRPFESVAFQAKGRGSYTLRLGQPSVLDDDEHGYAFTADGAWTGHAAALKDLKQGGWGAPRAFTPGDIRRVSVVVNVPYWPDLGGVNYHAMIAPLTRFALRGFLWYQGESNAARAAGYADLLRLLVESWRKAWGDASLAFLTVQLPGYLDGGGAPGDPDWPKLREAQARAMDSLPGTGLAVALDLGEWDDIHPKDKKLVGRRLALAALAVAYGRPVGHSGPRAAKLSLVEGALRLEMTQARGLALRAREARSFEVAGEDGIFRRARVRVDGEALVLSSRAVPQPRAARYAWDNDPLPELYNADGLPAAPFNVEVRRETGR